MRSASSAPMADRAYGSPACVFRLTLLLNAARRSLSQPQRFWSRSAQVLMASWPHERSFAAWSSRSEETAMHASIIDRRPAVGGLIQVCTPADIEYLVKESEVVTGSPGRKFVIYGADRLIYRIAWHPNGYHVERLDESDNPTSTTYLLPAQFSAHGLGEALSRGQLF